MVRSNGSPNTTLPLCQQIGVQIFTSETSEQTNQWEAKEMGKIHGLYPNNHIDLDVLH